MGRNDVKISGMRWNPNFMFSPVKWCSHDHNGALENLSLKNTWKYIFFSPEKILHHKLVSLYASIPQGSLEGGMLIILISFKSFCSFVEYVQWSVSPFPLGWHMLYELHCSPAGGQCPGTWISQKSRWSFRKNTRWNIFYPPLATKACEKKG